MIIKSVHVKNFCGLLDVILHCDSLTALVGGNGCGKSTFLRALELFYAPSPRITKGDFFNNDVSRDIEITVTYTSLNDVAKELFGPYLDEDNLPVTRVLAWNDGKLTARLHGNSLQHPDFAAVNSAEGKRAQRTAYEDIRKQPKYAHLPQSRTGDEAVAFTKDYERAHPDECVRNRDDGQFFGWHGVGKGRLNRFTDFLLIPAVLDASLSAVEGKGSPITRLMDLVARQAVTEREEVRQFKADTIQRHRELMSPDSLPELKQVENDLTTLLSTYIPESAVEIEWTEATELEFPMPRADVRLIEHGYSAVVANSGHGLQRTFIVSMLQRLAVAESSQATTAGQQADSDDPIPDSVPNLVLAIEEPELFQHPPRQRHFASILYSLANESIPGVAQKTQVIYSTHSAHFVGLDRFHQIRAFHKVDNGPGLPRTTRVIQVTGDDVAEELGRVLPGGQSRNTHTWEKVHARLHPVMTPTINEGFFAAAVVLVEGDEDRAALLTVARILGTDLDEHGVLVIACKGKTNIRGPLVIFRQFGINVYIIFDGDHPNPNEASNNRQFLQLLGIEPEDYPPTQVNGSFACFRCSLQATIGEEIGGTVFVDLIDDAIDSLGLRKRKDSRKNPMAVAQAIEEAYDRGLQCPTIESIVEKVLAIRIVGDSE